MSKEKELLKECKEAFDFIVQEACDKRGNPVVGLATPKEAMFHKARNMWEKLDREMRGSKNEDNKNNL